MCYEYIPYYYVLLYTYFIITILLLLLYIGKNNTTTTTTDINIINNNTEYTYNTSIYNHTIYTTIMSNIITTYYSIIGDLLPTLPVEIDIFTVFQLKLMNIVKNYIKIIYYTYKTNITADVLIAMIVFYDKLAYFSEKFMKTTIPQLLSHINTMRPEILRQCNIILVATLSEHMLKLFNNDEPLMNTEIDFLEVGFIMF